MTSTMTPVEVFTRAEAEARRAEIVRRVGNDEESFRERAEAYALNAEELAMFDEMEALDYILGR
jgi:hypothetical protein